MSAATCRCHGSEMICLIPLDEYDCHTGPCQLVPCPDCTEVGEPSEGPFDPLDAIRDDMLELLHSMFDEHATMDAYGFWESEEQRREHDEQLAKLTTAYRALDGDMALWSAARDTIARRYADV